MRKSNIHWMVNFPNMMMWWQKLCKSKRTSVATYILMNTMFYLIDCSTVKKYSLKYCVCNYGEKSSSNKINFFMINVFNQQKSGVLLKWGFEKRSKVQQSFFKMETLVILPITYIGWYLSLKLPIYCICHKSMKSIIF